MRLIARATQFPPPCGEGGLGRSPSRVGGAGMERRRRRIECLVSAVGLGPDRSRFGPAPPTPLGAEPVIGLAEGRTGCALLSMRDVSSW